MDKQTPTQIASEITLRLLLEINNNESRNWLTRELVENSTITKIREVILAYRTAWENELEFLNKLFNSIICSRTDGIVLEQRISELTSALKILNTKEAEK